MKYLLIFFSFKKESAGAFFCENSGA